MLFEKIKGQETAIDFLKRSITQDTLSDAYIFSGPSGTGKMMTAIALASSINCGSASSLEACGKCSSCVRIASSHHPDVIVISPSVGTNPVIKIDQIRSVARTVNLKPFEANKKVFIIDEAPLMTHQASNALLKTLEEPTNDSILILLADGVTTLLPTIVSRCRIVRFHPVATAAVQEVLENSFSMKPKEARSIAFLSCGRIGEALRLASQGVLARRDKVLEILAGEAECRDGSGLEQIDPKDAESALDICLGWLRDCMVLASGLDERYLLNGDRSEDLNRLVSRIDPERLHGVMERVIASRGFLRQKANPKLVMSSLSLKIRSLTTGVYAAPVRI
ncbi:MAG: DNA polymerase III subunit delta' [Candidatus Omnitrophota bacterium]